MNTMYEQLAHAVWISDFFESTRFIHHELAHCLFHSRIETERQNNNGTTKDNSNYLCIDLQVQE